MAYPFVLNLRLANFTDRLGRIAMHGYEMRLTGDHVSFVFNDIAALDDGNEILSFADLALQALPDLLAREHGRCSGWIDFLRVGAVYDDHFSDVLIAGLERL